MKKIVAAAVLAACTTTPALAQDVRAPFSGPFVGAVLGYDNVRAHVPATDFSTTRDGLLYGGNVGFDLNLGGAIVGIEGEYTDSDAKFRQPGYSMHTDRDLYVGGRLGGQVMENLALYAKGGYTNARFEETINTGGATIENAYKRDGYRLGAGVETSFRGLTGRVEYRYSNYGKLNGFNLERNQVAAIVGYRF